MARVDTLSNFLTDVADAIREKKGTSDLIQASDFDTEITNLPSGGDVDWNAIGYSSAPQDIIDDYNYSKNIYDNWIAQTNLSLKFQSNTNLVYMPLVDTSIATDMSGMFINCVNLMNIPLLDTGNVTTMANMIRGCNSLKTIPLFDTHNVTEMNNMFFYSISIETIPLLDTSKVTTFNQMFYNCTSLQNVPILDTSSVTNMTDMFSSCNNLTDTSLDNILQLCINATSYNGTKTLFNLGLRSSPYTTSRIQALPHYQDFLNAGWTIGY